MRNLPFNSAKLAQWTTADYYDYICVDEFHHAAANSYQELLSYYHPKILLGLTATPDRMDGKDILKYFDGKEKYRLPILWLSKKTGKDYISLKKS